ncbi:DUF7344 domain-containing protein [Halomarina ordinaria]|uniref:DUF7344 domain-containing protein n=1 Tax=Halomarina ordinaria TaxID=3033939 RepID=A0ABD5UEX7_9EURY|nr:hypothetical protein [Halomarina sp. PSRA2]
MSADTTPDTVVGATSTRYVVMALLREHQVVSLADLADEVATRRHDRPLADLSPTTVLEVYDELYEEHVPALERVGSVSYDQERDLVALSGYTVEETALGEEALRFYECESGE